MDVIGTQEDPDETRRGPFPARNSLSNLRDLNRRPGSLRNTEDHEGSSLPNQRLTRASGSDWRIYNHKEIMYDDTSTIRSRGMIVWAKWSRSFLTSRAILIYSTMTVHTSTWKAAQEVAAMGDLMTVSHIPDIQRATVSGLDAPMQRAIEMYRVPHDTAASSIAVNVGERAPQAGRMGARLFAWALAWLWRSPSRP